MNGRRPFYLIAILLALVAAVKLGAAAVSWGAKAWGGPTFGLADRRDPGRLPPYASRPAITGPYTELVEVQAPFITTHHSENASRLASFDTPPPEPVAIIEAGPTGTVTLPGGGRIRLRALRFFPQTANNPDFLPVEKVYCDPTGKWMAREEAMALNKLLSPGGDPALVQNLTSDNGLPWYVEVVLETDLEKEELNSEGLFDTLTGGQAGGGGGYGWAPLANSADGMKHLVSYGSVLDAVRPTPAVIWLRAKVGGKETLTLAPAAPQPFKLHGQEYTLRNITHYPANAETVFVGGPKVGPRALSGFWSGPGSFKVVFDTVPYGIAAVEAFDTGGNKFGSVGGGSTEWAFRGDPATVGRIEITSYPDYAYAIVKLPEFPVVPEANRQTSNLMKMVLPPTTVSNEDHWNQLVGSVLQVSAFGWRKNPPTVALAYPMDLGGKTVADLVAMEHSRYPPSEWAIHMSDGHARIEHDPLWTGLASAHPRLWWIVGKPNHLGGLLLNLAVLIALLKAGRLAQAAALRRALRPRGYDMLTIWDAEVLVAALGRKARKLPLYSDIAVIPGVDVTKIATVVSFMRSRGREEQRGDS